MVRPVFGNHVDSLMQTLDERRFKRPVSIFATPEQQLAAVQEEQRTVRPQEDFSALTQNRYRQQVESEQDPFLLDRVRSQNVVAGLSTPYLSQLEQTSGIGSRALEAERAKTIWRKLDEQARKAAESQQQTIYLNDENNPTPQQASGETQLPLSKFTITARYGQKGKMWQTSHGGIDMAAPTGSEIRPVRGGTVTKVENHPAYGNVVWVAHPDGTTTRYGHMSKFGKFAVGQQVGLGDVIGFVGSTGHSTGPHLHLGYYNKQGQTLDPELIIGELLRALGY